MDVFHFFANEFARLSRWRLSFSLVFPSPFECLLFWHSTKVSPPEWMLDVQRLSFARNSTFSLDAQLATTFLCRIFTDNLCLRTNRKSDKGIDIGKQFLGESNADADCDAECFLAANAQ